MLAVEVMACGRPVIAYGDGGARHTVLPGTTGELFDDQSPEGIARAVQAFDPDAYDTDAIRAHALQWDDTAFRERLRSEVALLAG